MNIREDLICEKMRSSQEIRNRLASRLHYRRQIEKLGDYSPKLDAEIAALKWVLRHDVSCRDYYKEKYGREL